MLWSFAKYVGCGNDFILFDNRKNTFPADHSLLIQKLCHRQWGIGADGVVLLENSCQADFRMRIFNCDGYEAEMCGNGIRCLMKFIQELGFTHSSYCIETMQRILSVSLQDAEVCVEMGDPCCLQWNIAISYEDQSYSLHYLDTGVPHAVLFVENVEACHLEQLALPIRHHPLFAPKGTNVNIAQRISEQKIKIRTYERGVERETLACGTGATAVALAAAYQYELKSPVLIQTLSQETLKIEFCLYQEMFSHVTMTGPAYFIYGGQIQKNSSLGALFY